MSGPVSEAAKAKAVELANAADPVSNWHVEHLSGGKVFVPGSMKALVYLVQEVSDAAKIVRDNRSGCNACDAEADHLLTPFILPDPVDPLMVAAQGVFDAPYGFSWNDSMRAFREELAKVGLEIRPVQP